MGLRPSKQNVKVKAMRGSRSGGDQTISNLSTGLLERPVAKIKSVKYWENSKPFMCNLPKAGEIMDEGIRLKSSHSYSSLSSLSSTSSAARYLLNSSFNISFMIYHCVIMIEAVGKLLGWIITLIFLPKPTLTSLALIDLLRHLLIIVNMVIKVPESAERKDR